MKKLFLTFIVVCMSMFLGENVWSSSLLGTTDGVIGGGTFTTSSEEPIGIYFSYGYGFYGGVYVFDDILITGGGEIELLPGDDPEFTDIVNALTDGTPEGESFSAAFGIAPFSSKGSYWDASPIPIIQDSIIESLVLTIDDFSFISTPYPGGETLWETGLINYTISAYGTTTPVPEPDLIEMIENLRKDFENHSHKYETGKGEGHNKIEVDSSLPEFPGNEVDSSMPEQSQNIEKTPLPAIDFATAVDGAIVSLSVMDLDPTDSDIESVIVYWGDRYRSEYNGILPVNFEHTYTRTGHNYHIRVRTVTTSGEKFNYIFRNDDNLLVSIP